MKIADPGPAVLVNEIELLLSEVSLNDARIIELGCGRAEKTRAIAATGLPARIVALEVDERQQRKNLLLDPMPKVEFVFGGAQAVPFDDESFDLALMFKSLHHVPPPLMPVALHEIHRLLRPGGWAWISEPVFAGELNELMRLFHDEQAVRAAAFAAIRQALDQGLFVLRKQLFFNTRSHFRDFDDFAERMIQVTHSDHRLSPETYAAVRDRFESSMSTPGATFHAPQRVDLLVKP